MHEGIKKCSHGATTVHFATLDLHNVSECANRHNWLPKISTVLVSITSKQTNKHFSLRSACVQACQTARQTRAAQVMFAIAPLGSLHACKNVKRHSYHQRALEKVGARPT